MSRLRVHMLQLKILCATTKTQLSQINRNKYFFKRLTLFQNNWPCVDKSCSHGFYTSPSFSNLFTTDIVQGPLNRLENAHLHNLHFLLSSHHFCLNELLCLPPAPSSPPRASTLCIWQSPSSSLPKDNKAGTNKYTNRRLGLQPPSHDRRVYVAWAGPGHPRRMTSCWISCIIKHKRLPNWRRTKPIVTNLGDLHVFLYINIIPYISQYSNMIASEKGYCDSTNESKGDLGFLWLAQDSLSCGCLIVFIIITCYFIGCRACWILVPQPGIKPMPPAVEAWSLNHWTVPHCHSCHNEMNQKKFLLYLFITS